MGEERGSQEQQLKLGDEISDERKADLQAAYEANIAAHRPPYEGVEIHTREELRWILRERE